MSPRRGTDSATTAREAALQMLYALDISGDDPVHILASYRSAHPLTPSAGARAELLLRHAGIERQRIEDLIQRHSVGWRLERMSVIDRNLLRLGTVEMLTGLAPSVAVQATVRLARKFSQPEAISFIQGLLEAIARDLGTQAEVAQHVL